MNTEIIANNEETVVETKKKAPRKYRANDIIVCRSVTYGELLLPGKKSQLLYTWGNIGDTTEVEYQDLQALRSTRSGYLYTPMFVIEDNELLSQWSDLKVVYDKIAALDVGSLFDLPANQFERRIRNIPTAYKDSLKNIASAKILDGSLDSVRKIKALDEALGTELMLFVK